MSTKPDPPTPEPAAPRRKWPLGATLAVPCAVMVGVLFFLPWYHTIGSMDFGEPRLLFPVSGLDRARGFDINARIATTQIGYRQLGDGRQQPISPLAVGPLAVRTSVGDATPWLWGVPVVSVGLMALAIVRLMRRGRRITSAGMLLAASALSVALAVVEVRYFGGATSPVQGLPGSFVVTAERALGLHMTVGAAALAALCCAFDVAFPGPVKDLS